MAPQKRMMLKADVNRIYDEEVYSEQKIREEKFFVRPTRQRKMKKGKLFSVGMGLDLPFCIIILVLLTIGMIMMFSASYAYAYYNQGDSYYYLVRQLIFAAIGVGIMFFLSFFNYNKLHKIAPIVLAISYLCLLVVLVLPGSEGVKRWIPLGIFNIQPSEIAKFAIILFFSHWCSKYYNKMQFARYSVLPGIIVFGSTALLLFLEPHYSGIVIIGILSVVMLYIGGMQTKYLGIGLGLIVGVVLILAVTNSLSYAMSRLDGWGQALEYTTDEMWWTTYQTRNSLYAIGSGGLWGLGLGQSRMKYLYIPEPQNDFIFSIVCEELGFIGAFVIIVLLVPTERLKLPLMSVIVPFPVSFSLILAPITGDPVSSVTSPFIFLVVCCCAAVVSKICFGDRIMLFSNILYPIFVPANNWFRT